jgi:hypothetical protein
LRDDCRNRINMFKLHQKWCSDSSNAALNAILNATAFCFFEFFFYEKL